MSLKTELTEKLEAVCANPQNEFERIISKNRETLKSMDEKQLSDIIMLKIKGDRLCTLIPYSREDIHLLVESGEVESGNKVAELEDCFNLLEYFFTKE
ncbi:MAG: hypothetical protein MJ168_04400 [Clostridia bacterium]|nr:hypothetical protein [Clostridia bacterium]